ncbi:restriction endonuclease [Natrinema amylolyticum]|uniref:restriction endonuclease n=1 Tax=Natrinema amylolyticum TaxID=2878679 RepID=UPI001CFB4938|nr:restriction endonuclease [Natrinema amylolyticum]
MECPSCGDEIEEGSEFCRFCGEELPAVPDDFDLKTELQSMDDYEFEHFVAGLWEKMGWDCEVSTASNDKGIDVRARKTDPYEQKALIQAKRYGEGNKVGSPDIQQYSSLKHQEPNVDKVIMVTTSSYSRNAEELASDLNVKLIGGDDLVDLVDQEGAEELISEYIDIETEIPEPDIEEENDSAVLEDSQRTRPTAPSGLETETTATHTDNSDVQLPETIWLKGIIGCTIGLWIAGMGMGTLPTIVVDPLLFISWIGLPICLYKDSQATLKATEWPQRRKYYIGIAVLPGFGLFIGPVYLLVRYAVHKGYSSSQQTISRNTTAKKDSTSDRKSTSTDLSGVAARLGVNHYTDATDHVKKFKREGKHDAAEELLLWCIDQAEAEARAKNYSTPPKWYYEHLGIIYRKDGRYEDERALLERYMSVCSSLGGEPRKELVDRLERSQEMAAK